MKAWYGYNVWMYVVKTGCFGFWSGSFRWRKVAVFVVKTYRFCLKNGTFWFPILVLLSSCTFYVPFMYLLCMYYVCLIFPKTLVYLNLGCYICIFVGIKQLYMYNLLEILSNNLCSWRIPVTGFWFLAAG